MYNMKVHGDYNPVLFVYVCDDITGTLKFEPTTEALPINAYNQKHNQ